MSQKIDQRIGEGRCIICGKEIRKEDMNDVAFVMYKGKSGMACKKHEGVE